ncbi:hypothetical protein K466DRAFT_499750 [Polyporus arcularius HHB13444]|uniref:Uncharacterized protein n=1 Tax=Polyporus arcularius HHB13444 TaxID=1314778 RepID=A0A5C3P1M6_9APHY|nr:hypothetical protein K466DRAFT_499750 [Polyporus arcularius HHB13444]
MRFCDMPTLLQFRATCRFNLTAVRQELHRSLRQALQPFIRNVEAFIAALFTNQAFVGGSVAVLFLARDLDITPANLDVFVPRDRGFPFLYDLIDNQGGIDRTVYPPTEEEEEEERRGWIPMGVWQIYRVSIRTGMVNIYVSVDTEALVPIACSCATHLITYVGPHHFGTAYPSLFFARRAILGSPTDTVDHERAMVKAVRRGFDVRMFPTQWEDLRLPDCGASRGICPMQARRLDDQTALCARFQPLETPHLDPTIVWRLDARPCGGECPRDFHDILAANYKWNVLRTTRRAYAGGRMSFNNV